MSGRGLRCQPWAGDFTPRSYARAASWQELADGRRPVGGDQRPEAAEGGELDWLHRLAQLTVPAEADVQEIAAALSNAAAGLDAIAGSPAGQARGRNGGACVEIGTVGPAVAVRDSKHPDGPLLAFAAETWRAFTDQVKATA